MALFAWTESYVPAIAAGHGSMASRADLDPRTKT
jgi:hypothetical protein